MNSLNDCNEHYCHPSSVFACSKELLLYHLHPKSSESDNWIYISRGWSDVMSRKYSRCTLDLEKKTLHMIPYKKLQFIKNPIEPL